ncbi:MAG: hypothetical protein NUK65_02565 [Firmicutes bacterium]|nr:hypothetical protein [Bacillota bacterium]
MKEMKVNNVMLGTYQPSVLAPKINKTDQEIKANQEFTAILYEKMLTSIMKPNTGQGMSHEDLAWQVLIKEIASEMSTAPKSLAVDLFSQKGKKS